MITGHATLAGVMGWPVSHSLSPRLHNHWLEQGAIDGAYLPLAVAPEHLGEALRVLPKMGFAGCNLTIPHKEAAVTIVDALSENARRIGAVNTVIVREDRSLYGKNTDATGFIENLKSKARIKEEHKQCAVILGSGGAARAVCVALIDEGWKDIVLLNRTYSKAHAVAEQLGEPVRAERWERREGWMSQSMLLVNTTSLGMKGQDTLDLSLHSLPEEAIVADIVYQPLMTSLLIKARARGNPIVTGLGMLVHQAVPGFKAWFEVTPVVDSSLESFLLEGMQTP